MPFQIYLLLSIYFTFLWLCSILFTPSQKERGEKNLAKISFLPEPVLLPLPPKLSARTDADRTTHNPTFQARRKMDTPQKDSSAVYVSFQNQDGSTYNGFFQLSPRKPDFVAPHPQKEISQGMSLCQEAQRSLRKHRSFPKLSIAEEEIAKSSQSEKGCLYYVKGRLLYLEKKYASSVQALRHSLRLPSISFRKEDAWFALGKSYFHLRNYNKSIHFLERARRVHRLNPDFYYRLGLSYKAKRFYKKALSLLEKALKLDPSHQQACLEAMKIHEKSKNRSKAIEKLNHILGYIDSSAGEDEYLFYIKAAKLYFKYGKIEQAQDICRKAIEISPQKQEAYFLLAKEAKQSNHYRSAELSYMELLRRDAFLPEAHLRLGMLYHKEMKLYLKARKHFQTYLHLEPQGKDAKKVISFLSLRQEDEKTVSPRLVKETQN